MIYYCQVANMKIINAQNQVELNAANLGINRLSVPCSSFPTLHQIIEQELPPPYKSLRQFEQQPDRFDTYPKDFFY